MSAANLQGSGNPRALHAAVVEALESYLYVLDMIRPTASNDCGDPGTAAALTTLNRLSAAMKPFPRRRLDPDPFCLTGEIVKIPFGKSLVPIHGTSLHDVWLRIVGRQYDALRIVPTCTFTDPNTGESFEGTKSTRGSEHETTLRALISPEANHQYTAEMLDAPIKIQHVGPADHFHFTELVWDDTLWSRVRIAVCDQAIEFYGFPRAPDWFLDQFLPSLNAEFTFALRNVPLEIAEPKSKAQDPLPPVSEEKGDDPADVTIRALNGTGDQKKPPAGRCTKNEANERAMELVKKMGSAFFDLSESEQAKRIGCSWATWSKTALYKTNKNRSARPAGRPRAVGSTDTIETHGSVGEKNDILNHLIAQQEADHEPSPLDPLTNARKERVYSPKRV